MAVRLAAVVWTATGVCQAVRKGRPHGAPKGPANLLTREVWVNFLKNADRPLHTGAFVGSAFPHKNTDDHLFAFAAEKRHQAPAMARPGSLFAILDGVLLYSRVRNFPSLKESQGPCDPSPVWFAPLPKSPWCS